MKHFLTPFLTIILLIQGVFGVPVIDFSKDHSIERVRESGANYKSYGGRNHFLGIDQQDIKVVLIIYVLITVALIFVKMVSLQVLIFTLNQCLQMKRQS